MKGKVHVGTSGWHYPHWRDRFYPANVPVKDQLKFYASLFDIVELNNTFYRLPPESAVNTWRETSPPHFCFAVKGSRFLTHMKKLKDPVQGLERFFSRVEPLGEKLGPVLFQLPPRFEANQERLATFLDALPAGHRYAFEFRDPSWNIPPIERLLRQHRAAYCIFDLAGFQSPLTVTTNFTYIRLHGPGGKYQGSYSRETLQAWAQRLRDWNLRQSYVFFDNDQQAFAAENALALRSIIDTAPSPHAPNAATSGRKR